MIDFLIEIFKESVKDDLGWALFAVAGQLMFAARFPVQWIMSERKGKSYMPLPFWLLSIAGAVIWVAYALHIRNFVMMVSVGLAIPIYLRNIQLNGKS